jgi:hypothetical protein
MYPLGLSASRITSCLFKLCLEVWPVFTLSLRHRWAHDIGALVGGHVFQPRFHYWHWGKQHSQSAGRSDAGEEMRLTLSKNRSSAALPAPSGAKCSSRYLM